MDKETRAKIAKDATIRMFDNGEISIKNVENIHSMYDRWAESEPHDPNNAARRDGLAEALDILKSK